MKLQKPSQRFWFGALCVLIVAVIGFAWISAVIPSWGATPAEVALALPGDEQVSAPQITWNHAITINAAPEDVYPWLVQIGDSRGGFYSHTFIENAAQAAANLPGRYVNASSIHPEWQTPAKGTGIIMTNMAIADYVPGQYVLATATKDFPGVQWTWLWELQKAGEAQTRLIVRHRIAFPEGAPMGIVNAVFNLGYVMERGMILGIRDRAEGHIPGALEAPLGIVVWLAALACGIVAAVRYVRQPEPRLHPLGVGLEAVIFLFIFTFIQPALWLRFLMVLVLVGSLVIAYKPGEVTRLIKARMAA